MLSANRIDELAQGSSDIASNLHDTIIQKILSRLIGRFYKTGRIEFTATDRWQIKTLQEAGFLLADIQKEIAKATGQQRKEINDALKKAGIESLENDQAMYERAGIAPSPFSIEMTRILDASRAQTLGLWYNYTGTTALQAQTWFLEACDAVYPLVATGAMSLSEALISQINTLSKGLDVVYPSGHKDKIEVATLRAVRTALGQTAGAVTAQRASENGVHLFLTSAHMGARPTHAEWQGKVFYVDWQRYMLAVSQHMRFDGEPVPDDEELRAKYPDFVQSTGIGTVTGLCGVNCRHSFFPYFEGISYNPFDIDREENDKVYENSQKARAMERRIRANKRKLMGLQDLEQYGNVPEAKTLLQRLRKQTAQYYEFCSESGIKPSELRLQI